MKSGNGKVQNDQVRSTPVPQNMQTSGLWAFESRHDPSFAMKTTRHRFLKLLWIREGSGAIEFDGEIKDCEMGDLVLVPPRLRHRIIDSVRNPLSLYGLGVDSNRLHCIASVLKGFSAGIYREPKFRTLLVEQRLRKILYLIDQPGAPSQLSSVATAIDLLAELALVLDPPKTSKI